MDGEARDGHFLTGKDCLDKRSRGVIRPKNGRKKRKRPDSRKLAEKSPILPSELAFRSQRATVRQRGAFLHFEKEKTGIVGEWGRRRSEGMGDGNKPILFEEEKRAFYALLAEKKKGEKMKEDKKKKNNRKYRGVLLQLLQKGSGKLFFFLVCAVGVVLVVFGGEGDRCFDSAIIVDLDLTTRLLWKRGRRLHQCIVAITRWTSGYPRHIEAAQLLLEFNSGRKNTILTVNLEEKTVEVWTRVREERLKGKISCATFSPLPSERYGR